MTQQTFTPLEMLGRLVSFETTSDRSNLELISFVAAYLDGWNVPYIRVPDAGGTKEALLATLGPMIDGGVVLSGHVDTVPVAGQVWTSDPFTLRVADGRAYGRGAVDMKGFCALALALVPDMLAAGLKRPVHILLSYDEETTCLGSTGVIERFGQDLPRPSCVIVGEPTSLEVADAHKSVVTFDTVVKGRAAHSAMPELGASAVRGAAELIAELFRIHDEMVDRGDPSGRFAPPYSVVHVGTMRGGNARNILAQEASFNWEFRGQPDLDEDEVPGRIAAFAEEKVLPRMRLGAPEASVTTVSETNVPGLAPDPGSLAETLALRLAGKNRTIALPFGTEAGHFQRAGIPTVVCGPGSITQAHQADEYISLDDLAEGEAFLRRLIDTLRN